jgi:hypothetical protein
MVEEEIIEKDLFFGCPVPNRPCFDNAARPRRIPAAPGTISLERFDRRIYVF